MKEEVKIIIEKYTGKTIDYIPDRFIDGQTLEIRKLIRFIKSCSLLDNPCEEHTDFVGEVCPVCLQELRENLECCGNCKKYVENRNCYNMRPGSYCPGWLPDGLTRKDRE